MDNMECYIVCDLLPLYIDKACSEQTAKFVEAHLQSCKNCRKLYDEMNSDIQPVLHTPEFESRRIFRHAQKSILGIIIALAAMISCIVINIGGAWLDFEPGIGNLIVTIFYIIFWSIFSLMSRDYTPLVNISFAIGLITFISSVDNLIVRLFGGGEFAVVIAVLLGIFSSVPFYGLRFFMEWNGLNVLTMILSLCWLIFAWHTKRKLKRTTHQ